ncbi:tryptophan halogenase family protein [Colwellia sp. MEBiC06753]
MSTALKKLVIVGGGAAGWMTALYLTKWFNSDKQTYAITVVESEDIGTIGVGEATVHTLRYFFSILGIDEQDLLKKTNGTLKSGIMFRNWMKPVNGEMHEYFHPFEAQPQIGKMDISLSWLLSEQYKKERFDQSTCLSSALIAHQKSPKLSGSKPYEGCVPYGYHLDATLMGRYLRDMAVAAGVEHIVANVNDVILDNGNISAVHTDKGHQLHGDVFIDCTGFHSLLINQLKADNWQSFEDALPCNRAVAIQTTYPENTPPKPYTAATALTNGWAWEIDLVGRRGNGYVYDGNRLTPEQAEAELLAHIGVGDSNGDNNIEAIKTTHLKMNIGCRHEFWVGNCIAIGLSGGFIEPLESTGLHLIELAVRLLSTHVPAADTHDTIKQSYNKLMNEFYASLKDFIVLHYCITDRDDTEFWQHAQTTAQYSGNLASKLELWRHKYCEKMDMDGSNAVLFSENNYRYILYGMDYLPTLNGGVDQADSQQIFDYIKQQANHVAGIALTHSDYLKRLNA